MGYLVYTMSRVGYGGPVSRRSWGPALIFSLLNISRSKNMERAVYTVLSISVLLKHHFFFYNIETSEAMETFLF